jgi:putative DNA primase/helicase
MADRRDIWEEMRGRWRGVLPAFGFTDKQLSGKNGPCPMCGGKDRWRFLDSSGNGTWICNSCGSGSGIDLLKAAKGWAFRQCAEELRAALGDRPPCASEPRSALSEDERKALLVRLWKQTTAIAPGDHVDRYLVARHLGRPAGEYPADLRTCLRCEVKGVPGVEALPGMVALVRDPEGKGATLHRTYLGDGAKARIDAPKRVMPGPIAKGAAVRLAAPVDGLLGIAEGIETALAAAAMWSVPVWAALNAGMMEAWRPPEGVRRVVVLADNDGNFAGHASAYALAHRLATLPDAVDVQVWVPPTDGFDWADEWARTRKQDEEGERWLGR